MYVNGYEIKTGANLRGANLAISDLKGANLKGANLEGANLEGANLEGANLEGANLEDSNMGGANLWGAYLGHTDLRDANLRGTHLVNANLEGANLRGAKLPHFQIVPSEGDYVGWKKTTQGTIRVQIPSHASRTSTLVGRKCRASLVVPLDEGGYSPTRGNLKYTKGVTVVADKYDDDIRIECTSGIHFFMTKLEAEEW